MLWSSTLFLIRASCILLVVLAPIDIVSAQDLAMADQQEEIETREVVVSATKTPVPVTQVTSAVQVISGKELEQKKIKTVIDALRLADGVFASSSGGPGTEATVKMRGAFSKHTLVLIDGVIVNSAMTGSYDFSNLTSDNI
ncbi:TonB-dependent receptor, partial [Petrachloros mirabilis]